MLGGSQLEFANIRRGFFQENSLYATDSGITVNKKGKRNNLKFIDILILYFANKSEVKIFVNTATVVTEVLGMSFGGDKYVFAVDRGKEGYRN